MYEIVPERDCIWSFAQSQLLGCVCVVNLLVDHLWFVMYIYSVNFLIVHVAVLHADIL